MNGMFLAVLNASDVQNTGAATVIDMFLKESNISKDIYKEGSVTQ